MEPVGLYVHIPFCVRKCNYCDFPSYTGFEESFHAYVGALCTEMDYLAQAYGPLHADTVFIGGGTPSLLSAADIGSLVQALRKAFIIDEEAEITLEVNPGTVSRDKAEAWRDAGFNRISMGLQAAQDHLLQAMGRIHTREQFFQSLELIRDIGFWNINADIIFGVPGQTMEDWLETLELVLQSGVCHISAYGLQIEKDTPWFELQKKGELPYMDEELERAMYEKTIERLHKEGFYHYEISNFSRPNQESRHNLKYWTGRPYLGIGAAAHSFIRNVRTANSSDPAEYMNRLTARQSPQSFCEPIDSAERLSERFFLGLRLIQGVCLNSLKEEFGQEAVDRYTETILKLERRKLVIVEGNRLRLSRLGLDYANQVWMEFL